MNYLKLYATLVKKAKSRDAPDLYERHHVFPKSIYGKNNFLVKLSPREHYVAHALLYRGFKQRYGNDHIKTRKMFFAFWAMHCKGPRHSRSYVNSRTYQVLKLEFRERIRVRNTGSNNPFFGRKHSVLTRRKLSLMNGGDGNVSGFYEFLRKNQVEFSAEVAILREKQKHWIQTK